jgi:hypothetical protein
MRWFINACNDRIQCQGFAAVVEHTRRGNKAGMNQRQSTLPHSTKRMRRHLKGTVLQWGCANQSTCGDNTTTTRYHATVKVLPQDTQVNYLAFCIFVRFMYQITNNSHLDQVARVACTPFCHPGSAWPTVPPCLLFTDFILLFTLAYLYFNCKTSIGSIPAAPMNAATTLLVTCLPLHSPEVVVVVGLVLLCVPNVDVAAYDHAHVPVDLAVVQCLNCGSERR